MSFYFINSGAFTAGYILIMIVIVVVSNVITAESFAANGQGKSDLYINNDATPITIWNNLISELGSKEKLSPPEFARVYALVYISIYDSLLAAENVTSDESFYISSLTEAASTVLTYLFPNDTNDIINFRNTALNLFQDDYNVFIEKGIVLGDQVAKEVINYARKDNSDLRRDRIIPEIGSCVWNGTNPVNPTAGFWRTYILQSGSEIQSQRPEICNSEADLLDLKQTYELWEQRTEEQISAVHYWGDKPPPAIWNTILNEKIQYYNMSIFEAAFSTVYLNVGVYDAFVSCWYAKYSYWTARPFQRITNITTEIPTPNFPGYPSGHSVISAVAGRVLGEIFPIERDFFNKQSIEAGLSRLWAGIHFKQDVTNGMDQGNEIAEKVVRHMHKNPHTFIYNSSSAVKE